MNDILPVGSKLNLLREERHLSQRGLAERAGVSANAISLIERSEISPSVATLQRLAVALGVRMSYFFDSTDETPVVYAKNGTRPTISSDGVVIESIGARLREQVLEPFYLTLAPYATCGEDEVVHLGQEFVCCLRGRIEYDVEHTKYILDEGDFLLFRADLPHCWRNPTDKDAVFLLVLEAPESPADLARQHFPRYPSVAYLG